MSLLFQKGRKAKTRKALLTRKRLYALACAALLTLPFQNARAVGLKENTVVTDNTIKLGDIFYGLGTNEDRVLGMAPRPGQEMTLNARTLLRIALAMDLQWRPSSAADHVILRREATVIDHDTIASQLKNALSDKGVGGRFAISIPQDSSEIVLPHDQPATLDVTRISYDRNSGRFDAMLAAPSKDNPIQQVAISGLVQPVVEIPVLKENIQNGRIIRASDIDFVDLRENDFKSGTVVDPQALVGMTPRRMAFAGRPLLQNEIIAPQIVARGEMVTINLHDGPLNLTAQGKALENGAKGDMIRVLNTASNITLQALVTGEKEVQVASN
ncbi:MAG: flagellar basal body P-ring formation protein FlgA [Alphaproteobacteria bacterium]|nr:flagellar basal body P-ring formation protein FlgA [Alphaproteobacteria bacterium]